MTERTKNIDMALIYELWQAYMRAANDGDLDLWLSLWIDDGVQMPLDAPRHMGKAQMRQGMRPLFDLYRAGKTIIQLDEVQILGDSAYAHGTYEFKPTAKTEGEIRTRSSFFLSVLKKQADGSWKIAIDCHSSGSVG